VSFQCEYAVIRFHRHGVLAPDYAVISTQEALLARIYKRAEQGYSFAFWLKNLQTQNGIANGVCEYAEQIAGIINANKKMIVERTESRRVSA